MSIKGEIRLILIWYRMLSKFLQSVSLAILVVISVVASRGPRAMAQIPDVPGWQLFWHDEFDGNTSQHNELDSTQSSRQF